MTNSKTLNDKVIFFITSNINKYHEAKNLLEKYEMKLSLLRIEIQEIQNDNIKEIAKTSVIETSKKICLPIIVEDSGLFINSLSGFPGPYSDYVQRTIGSKGILKLMEGKKEREAYFQSVIAFKKPNGKLKCFEGRVHGRISEQEQGSFGFGFDPIFEPIGSPGRTLAQMTIEEKNNHSHRAKSLKRYGEWYKSILSRKNRSDKKELNHESCFLTKSKDF